MPKSEKYDGNLFDHPYLLRNNVVPQKYKKKHNPKPFLDNGHKKGCSRFPEQPYLRLKI
nr:hypothetical protein [Bacteroidota bacterium]